MKKNFCFLLVLLIAISELNIQNIKAQSVSKQLVFTKAMIDKKTSQVWFEVFNPSDESMTLSSFRISGVKSPNILPADIRRNNGIVLNYGERLIICGDKQSFENAYENNSKIVEIEALKNIGDGGFVAMNYMDGIENAGNIIRFGDRSNSLQVSDKVGDDQLLGVTNDGLYYAREINSNGRLLSWEKINPTSGK
ncbi:MAG: hypothetical protein WAV89_11290 [Ignavibacteriaceae bacterium]